MGRKSFTLIELLIVISMIALLFSIIVPCLMRAKDSALELAAMQTEVDEEGKVRLEIRKLTNRKLYDGIYMIKIEPPRLSRVKLQKPYPAGMKLIRRDDQDYIKWRPKPDQIGIHDITVVFIGEKTTEQKIKVYVYNKKLLEAEKEEKSDGH